MVDVTADNAIGALAPRLVGKLLLERADEADRVLDLQLGPGRERPIGKTEPAPDAIEPVVREQRGLVGPVAEKREPAGIIDHDVELIAVDDEEPPAVRSLVDRGVHHLDAAERHAEIGAGELVVVAGQENHPCSLANLAQQFLDDVVMGLRPVPAAFERPAIDDVADEVDRLRIMILQKIDQKVGLAAPLAKVDIGDEQRAEFGGFGFVTHAGPALVRGEPPAVNQSRVALP